MILYNVKKKKKMCVYLCNFFDIFLIFSFLKPGCNTFPHTFSATRWLANIPVCQRALEIWDDVKEFINTQSPKTHGKSLDSLRDWSKDDLLEVKANCFMTLARDVNKFLTLFQSGAPMMPFLATELKAVLTNLLKR